MFTSHLPSFFALLIFLLCLVPSNLGYFQVRIDTQKGTENVRVALERNDANFLQACKAAIANCVTLPPTLDMSPYKLFCGECQLGTLLGIVDGEELWFRIPGLLTRACGSDWRAQHLDELKVAIKRASTLDSFLLLLGIAGPADDAEEKIVKSHVDKFSSLTSLTIDNFRTEADYEKLRKAEEDSVQTHKITKSLYAMRKYPNVEATVVMFVLRLLDELGYNSGLLLALPQLPLMLPYHGGARAATPDITILDILSFLRTCVVKDKSVDNMVVNSLPQLYAELLAMFFANVPKEPPHKRRVGADGAAATAEDERERNLLGVRVRGHRFFFYVAVITEHVENAITTGRCPSDSSDLFFLSNGSLSDDGFDFLIPNDRAVILRLLTRVRMAFVEQASRSARINSK
jgi:hypothetical protein